MEVPLVVNGERLYAIGDGMLGELFEVSGPVWIHRPMCLEVAAGPIQKCVARLSFWHFDAVVNTRKADAFVH